MSNEAWLSIAGWLGSYTPGAGIRSGRSNGSSGSSTNSGSGIIWPGLSETSLSSIRTVPEPALFTAAPPLPAALPESVVRTISRRPPGSRSGRQSGHVYSLGSAWLMAPPLLEARLSRKRASSTRTRPGDQFWMPAPASSEKPSRIVRSLNVTSSAVGWISNSRSMPRCSIGEPSGGKPPSTIVAPRPVAPAPSIDHRVADVEVARAVAVLVERRDLELVDAGLDRDRVGAGTGVGLLDRGAQRAAAAERRADPVAGTRVARVDDAVDLEGRGTSQSWHEHRERDHDQRRKGACECNASGGGSKQAGRFTTPERPKGTHAWRISSLLAAPPTRVT